jgi:uncharacterized protein
MSKTVAVVGASSDRRKFGNKALRAFVAEGYTVFAINPNEEAVEGLQTYASVLDVPGPIDMATVYVQPEVAERLLPEFEQKQIAEIWINPGAESDGGSCTTKAQHDLRLQHRGNRSQSESILKVRLKPDTT